MLPEVRGLWKSDSDVLFRVSSITRDNAHSKGYLSAVVISGDLEKHIGELYPVIPKLNYVFTVGSTVIGREIGGVIPVRFKGFLLEHKGV